MIAMPGIVMHVNAVMGCAHSPTSQVQVPPAQTRVLVSGQLVATSGSVLMVTGCPGVNGVICSSVTWLMQSTRVRVEGQSILLQPPPLAPMTPAPATVVGAPPNQILVSSAQLKVMAQ